MKRGMELWSVTVESMTFFLAQGEMNQEREARTITAATLRGQPWRD